MRAILAEDLTHRFGDVVALRGVDLSVEQGEFFGLLGPNGAGKTTLVRILTGQLEPTSGRALTLGVSPDDPIGIKKGVGIVPESESPPTFLTAREFLELVCRIRGVVGIPERVHRWFDFFDLREKQDVLCRDLSKGQRQKVMLAAALIHEPELLILDEPFINLDPIFQRKLREYLKSLTAGGRTVFMCSHILEIVERLCTRVAVINKGSIVAQGKLDEMRRGEGEGLEDIFMRLVEGIGDGPEEGKGEGARGPGPRTWGTAKGVRSDGSPGARGG